MDQEFRITLLSWRARAGLTMAAAARQLSVPYRTWQDWEAGLHAPRAFARRVILERLEQVEKLHRGRQQRRRR